MLSVPDDTRMWAPSWRPWTATLPRRVDVRVGSKPEVAELRRDVCFNPESGHWTDIPGGPFSATTGLMHRRDQYVIR